MIGVKSPSMWLEMKFKGLDKPLRIKIGASSFVDIDRRLNEAIERGGEDKLDDFFEMVVDWNLKKGGKKLPCTKENKEKYLKFYFEELDKGESIRVVSLDLGDPELSDQIMTALGWKESIH